MTGPSVTPARLVEELTREHALPEGDFWLVSPYEDVAGWFIACPHDATGFPYVGAVSLYGPGGRVLQLSSNPGIHGFDETAAVIAELAGSDLTDADLVAEIGARTAARR